MLSLGAADSSKYNNKGTPNILIRTVASNGKGVLTWAICVWLIVVVSFGLGSSSYAGDKQLSPLLVKHTYASREYFTNRENYFLELIELALKNSGENYQLQSVKLEPLTENRAIHYLQSGIYDIHWLHTSVDLEQRLLPIRIPLYKGLIGWRLMLIHKARVDDFSRVNTLKDLQKFSVLQGGDWPDIPILEQAGFKLITSSDFLTLSRMLDRSRGDMFPRSVTEVWEELEDYAELDIVLDENLALVYPAAYYLFVGKNNVRLKKAVEKGLNIAIADGSFDKAFYSYFGEAIKKANLHKRKIISISNPSLLPETPLERKELWFSIDNRK